MTQPTAWTPFTQAPFNETELMGYYDPLAGQGNYVQGTAGAANVNTYAWSTSLLMPVALKVDSTGALIVNATFAGTIGTVAQGAGGASAWLVSAASLPLPTGAATEATLAGRLKPADTLTAVTTVGTVTNPVGVKGADATSVASVSNPFNTLEAAQLVQGRFDYIALSNYTTDNQPQTVTYKSGGSAGTTVATLTLVFSNGAAGGNLSSVTKA